MKDYDRIVGIYSDYDSKSQLTIRWSRLEIQPDLARDGL